MAWIGADAPVTESLGGQRAIEENPEGRLGYCGKCGEEFCVCPKCDHGQAFCPDHQFKHRRADHVDAARERHAKSIEGQKETRSRKRRQRMREYCQAHGLPIPGWAALRTSPRPPPPPPRRTSVTDTGSPSGGSCSKICAPVNQTVPSTETGQRPREQRPEPLRLSEPERTPCSFCGHLCGPFYRYGPKGRSPSVRVFRRTGVRSPESGEALGSTRPP